jgi:DNA-binding GntR family transcriptional regulator
VVDDDFVRNIFEIREALEPLIVRRFCQRVTEADLARLRQAASEFARVAGRKTIDFEALNAANHAFHAVITEGEVNTQALEVMDRYDALINATRGRLRTSPARLRERVQHHSEIVEAIESGDAEEAARVAAAHVRAAGEDMLSQMRQSRTISAQTAGLLATTITRRRRRVAAGS